MTVLTQGQQRAEFVIWLAERELCNDLGTITGGDYAAGTVLGQVTADGKFTQLAPAASDGSEVAAAILWDNVDASAADQSGVVLARLAVVNDAELVWPAGITGPQQTTAIGELLSNDIKVKQ